MNKIIHLVPYDGIGGVEVAARSMGKTQDEKLDFEVRYIFPNGTSWKSRGSTFNPLYILSSARKIIIGAPEVLIVSLWRSAIVGLLAKIIRPRIKLVTFIHNTVDSHWLDFIITRLVILISEEVWVDSRASLSKRLSKVKPKRYRVISFVTQRLRAIPTEKLRPNFIFWGSISAQKGLDKALKIFAEVLECRPDARFMIVGPDGGALESIQQLCSNMKLDHAVDFMGPADFQEIVVYANNASFYLQTSIYEGMAMSVVESMQLGLVPVVTPVGEVGSYCKHNKNTLLVDAKHETVKEILTLLNDREKYLLLRKNAIKTWSKRPLYKDSVLQACKHLTGK